TRHDAIDEVAVVGLPDERWGQIVVAFVKRKSDLDEAALDAHCRAAGLPSHKLPRRYVFVAEVPKSPVGKLLRRMLVSGDYEPE
ncbi:MAG: long-chain fatty acid--CoA ligase, partial [Pseudomonadota bacterium]